MYAVKKVAIVHCRCSGTLANMKAVIFFALLETISAQACEENLFHIRHPEEAQVIRNQNEKSPVTVMYRGNHYYCTHEDICKYLSPETFSVNSPTYMLSFKEKQLCRVRFDENADSKKVEQKSILAKKLGDYFRFRRDAYSIAELDRPAETRKERRMRRKGRENPSYSTSPWAESGTGSVR